MIEEKTGMTNLARALTRERPNLPEDAQPIASILIEQIGHLETYERPAWATFEQQTLPGIMKRQLETFEGLIARS